MQLAPYLCVNCVSTGASLDVPIILRDSVHLVMSILSVQMSCG